MEPLKHIFSQVKSLSPSELKDLEESIKDIKAKRLKDTLYNLCATVFKAFKEAEPFLPDEVDLDDVANAIYVVSEKIIYVEKLKFEDISEDDFRISVMRELEKD